MRTLLVRDSEEAVIAAGWHPPDRQTDNELTWQTAWWDHTHIMHTPETLGVLHFSRGRWPMHLISNFSYLLCISVPWPVYLCNYWLSQTSHSTLRGICWFSSLKSLLHCFFMPLHLFFCYVLSCSEIPFQIQVFLPD